jgi:hypothetical protein
MGIVYEKRIGSKNISTSSMWQNILFLLQLIIGIQSLGELQDIPDRPLRRGYTTGACATACAKAALWSLVTQHKITETQIQLPIGETVSFQVQVIVLTKKEASYTTIKDAGDDPDVTRGRHQHLL